MKAQIKKIDVHAHAVLFPELAPPLKITGYRCVSAPEVLDFYDRLGIEKGLLLPIVSMEGQWHVITNEACKTLSDRYPDRFLWACNVDPRAAENAPDSDLIWLLRHYMSLGARSLGELTSNLYADDPRTENLLASCEALGLPVTIHVSPAPGFGYGIVDDLGLPRLEKMLKKHPKLTILGHSQPFWAEMSADVTEENRNTYPEGPVKPGRLWRLMEECPNLCCDLSAGSGANALMRDPENAVRFLETFSDRIFYGCDICTVTNTFPFAFRDFLDGLREHGEISEETYYKIARGNAERLLHLN